jgi:hypothetical protein
MGGILFLRFLVLVQVFLDRGGVNYRVEIRRDLGRAVGYPSAPGPLRL